MPSFCRNFLPLVLAIHLVGVGCSNAKKGDEPQVAVDEAKGHRDAIEPEGKEIDRNPIPDKAADNQPRDENRAAKEFVLQEFKTPQGLIVRLNADHDPWADAVVSFKRGKPAPKKHDNPWAALGKPQGHSVALGHGGTLIVQFIDNVLIDGPGDDLVIFEVGKAVEPTHVAISENGTDWISIGRAKGSKSTLDIGPFVKPGQRFRYVRLTDAKSGKSVGSAFPGADINAVGALHSLPVPDAPSRKEIESRWKK